MTTNQQHTMPPVKIAFIIDGVIVDILHTDERLGAIFLSEPVIVDVTDKLDTAVVGSSYDSSTGTFSKPN